VQPRARTSNSVREADHRVDDTGRRSDLLAAAEALRDWAYARRATWTSDPLPPPSSRTVHTPVVPVQVAAAQPAAAPPMAPPSVPIPVPAPPAPAFEPPPAPIVAPSVVAFEPPPIVEGLPIADVEEAPAAAEAPVPEPKVKINLEDWREPAVTWGRRLGVAAAIALVVGGAYWAVQEYGTQVVSEVRDRTAAALPDVNGDDVASQPAVGRASLGATGTLEIQSNPTGASISIDGKPRGTAPMTITDLSAGSHSILLESDKGAVRRTIQIAANRTVQINEAIFSGWLHVSMPIEMQINEGTRALRLDERNEVLLPPGVHNIRFENSSIGYSEVRQVEVKPGVTTSIAITLPNGVLSVSANEPAVVLVDGQPVGQTPVADYPIKLGTRDIVVRSDAGVEKRFTITATVVQPARLDVDFSR
jgi:hypothetical protein